MLWKAARENIVLRPRLINDVEANNTIDYFLDMVGAHDDLKLINLAKHRESLNGIKSGSPDTETNSQ
ncbi:MAG: hypothetical protein ACI82Z_000507 [Cellvibrionaceae bacterium]|jgi:hypothetical protein